MVFFDRRPTHTRRTRTSRDLHPAVEGFEPRRLLSGTTVGGMHPAYGGNQPPIILLPNDTISGTVYRDLTGNRFSSDDRPLAGVIVRLFSGSSSEPELSTTTDANGDFSFSVPAGIYSVQQVVPPDSLATRGVGGYSVWAVAPPFGISYSGLNFDDFHLPPPRLLPQASMSGSTSFVAGPAADLLTTNPNAEYQPQDRSIDAEVSSSTPTTVGQPAASAALLDSTVMGLTVDPAVTSAGSPPPKKT